MATEVAEVAVATGLTAVPHVANEVVAAVAGAAAVLDAAAVVAVAEAAPIAS